MNKGFIFRRKYFEAIESLPEKERLECYTAICRYAIYGEEPKGTAGKLCVNLFRKDIEKGVEQFNARMGRKSADYAEWRKSVFARDNYTCRLCGQIGGKLNAHHIKPYAKYESLRLDVENGITLCEKCHKGVHRAR